MNAILSPAAGDASDVHTVLVPVPRPRRGGVLVRTRAVDLSTSGASRRWSLSGEVVLVGSGVTEWSRGDRVVAIAKDPQGGQRRLGADFVVLPAAELHAIPTNVSFLSAAAVAHSFATAWEALFHRGRLGFAERVVVIGASHPAGLAAVQISRWRNCQVVVVADGHQAPRLRALGADRVVSQSAPNLPDHVTAGLGGHRATVVVDVVGAALQPSQRLLDHEGRLVLTAPSEPQLVDTDLLINRRVQILGSGARFDTVDLRHIFKLLSNGIFIPVIDSIHRFSGAAQAFRKAGSADRIGSVLLVPDDLFRSEEKPTRINEEG